MVNAAKRMRYDIKSLWRIQYLPGNITLPTGPQPQLKSIYLRVPAGHNKFMKFYVGSRLFWQKELRRLKFRNPSLPVTVETISKPKINEPFYLTLEYHSTDAKALGNIETHPLPKPMQKLPIGAWAKSGRGSRLLDIDGVKEGEIPTLNGSQAISDAAEAKVRFWNPSRLWREMGKQFHLISTKLPKVEKIRPVEMSRMIKEHCPKSNVVALPSPAVDPAAPQTSSPPQIAYSRKVTTPITGVRHVELWNWIRRTGNLPHVQHAPPEKEVKLLQEAKIQARQSRLDRRRVAIGLGEKRSQEKALKTAREEAQRMTAEAA